MCWSFEVSVGFAAAEVALLVLMLALPKSRKYYHFVPLLLTVIIVEFGEAVIYKAGVPPLSDRLEHKITCPFLNEVLTSVIMIAVTLQPWAFVYYVHKANIREEQLPHEYKQVTLFVLLLTLVNFLSVVRRSISTALHPETARITVPLNEYLDNSTIVLRTAPDTYDYAISCSYSGPNGHLYWQWGIAAAVSSFEPNWVFIYALSMLLIIVLLPDKYEAIFFAMFLSILFIFSFVWTFPEAGSMWCWTGISLHVFYVIYPNLLKDRLPPFYSWSQLFPCCSCISSPEAYNGDKKDEQDQISSL